MTSILKLKFLKNETVSLSLRSYNGLNPIPVKLIENSYFKGLTKNCVFTTFFKNRKIYVA